MIGKNSKETISNLDLMEFKERIEFIREYKVKIIEQKKAEFKEADAFAFELSKSNKTVKSELLSDDALEDSKSLDVSVIANLSMYFDSHRDVQGDKCWNQSIKNTDLVYHTQDHSRHVSDYVGIVKDIKMETVRLDKLGVKSHVKEGEALILYSNVVKKMDEKIHYLYGKGVIKQHSVGMYYVKLQFAVNDKEDDDGYIIYNKYIDKIINKEEAEKYGYFFYVAESKLIEVSAVTRGSNPITPTNEVSSSKNEQSDTQNEQSESDTQKEYLEFYKHLN